MRKLALLLLCAVTSGLAACGEDAPPKPKPAAAPAAAGGPGKPGAAGSVLVLKAKVDKQYRKELLPTDFQGDPTGNLNRNPFQSFLVAPAASGPQTPVHDECENRKVAEKYAYNDLRLIGIVVRGTSNLAMFRDPTGTGRVVAQNDCLSKEKAKIVEITPSCVRIEIRGEAPPGAPAPPAHEDKRCLHPNDIEIE